MLAPLCPTPVGSVFLAGSGTAGGLIGTTPNLSDLDDGDIKMNIDMRQSYAAILEDWLDIRPLSFLAAASPKRRFPARSACMSGEGAFPAKIS